AQAEAPDDPWVQTFTYMWDADHVTGPFARLLERYPRHPFAPTWAHMLVGHTTGEQQAAYAAVFDDLTHEQLVRTAALRPGFDGTEKEFRLAGADAPLAGFANAFRSDHLGMLVYVRALSGSAYATLEVQTDEGILESSPQLIDVSDVRRYRMFKWTGPPESSTMALRLRTVAGRPAQIQVRDIYPLVENPHGAVGD